MTNKSDEMLARIDAELAANEVERAANSDVSIELLVEFGKLPKEALNWRPKGTE